MVLAYLDEDDVLDYEQSGGGGPIPGILQDTTIVAVNIAAALRRHGLVSFVAVNASSSQDSHIYTGYTAADALPEVFRGTASTKEPLSLWEFPDKTLYNIGLDVASTDLVCVVPNNIVFRNVLTPGSSSLSPSSSSLATRAAAYSAAKMHQLLVNRYTASESVGDRNLGPVALVVPAYIRRIVLSQHQQEVKEADRMAHVSYPESTVDKQNDKNPRRKDNGEFDITCGSDHAGSVRLPWDVLLNGTEASAKAITYKSAVCLVTYSLLFIPNNQ
jgi:hypothetical protein